MILTIGIDPGLTGAVAVLDDKGAFVSLFDMPVMERGAGKAKVKKEINGAELAKELNGLRMGFELRAVLERVSVMPGQGVVSQGSIMESLGLIKGVLAALEIPYELAHPQTWKAYFKLRGGEKDAARSLAQRYFPKAQLGLKKHHNRAEALLIAKWGMEKGR